MDLEESSTNKIGKQCKYKTKFAEQSWPAILAEIIVAFRTDLSL